MHDPALMHGVYDRAESKHCSLSEALIAALCICRAHHLGEGQLTDDFAHAVDLVALFEAVDERLQLFDISELFYGSDSLPKFVVYLFVG